MGGAMSDEMASRLRSLTPRERRVLVLSADGKATVNDVADVLGVSTAVVTGVRQAIRRKLAIPKGAELAEVLEQRGIVDLTSVIDLDAAPRRSERRRRHHVLRAAIRELETSIQRIDAKGAALSRLATSTSDAERVVLLSELEAVQDLAAEMQTLRDATLAAARAGADVDLPDDELSAH